MAVKVIWNKPAIDNMLNGPTGEVGRWLSEKGTEFVEAARIQVGKSTGFLAGSIHMRHSRGARHQELRIGSELSYALAHHEGTKPHIIKAKNGGALRFIRGTRIVYVRAVRHPGTEPNKYLADNLHIFRS